MKVVLKKTMLEKFTDLIEETHIKTGPSNRIDYVLLTEREAAELYSETALARAYSLTFRTLANEKEKAMAMHNGSLMGYTIKVEWME
jgi:hypothetical protein